MAECATELREKLGAPVDNCPAAGETVMFITPTGYLRRTWAKLIQCIVSAVQEISAPDDEDVIIDNSWDGRNYYERPDLDGKRFRLFRNGILLNSQQWRPLTGGGWELLTPNDIQEEGQVFTIVRY